MPSLELAQKLKGEEYKRGCSQIVDQKPISIFDGAS